MNQYLEQEYCDDHNRRFALDAASNVDYHLPAPGAKQQREIFRLETERVLGNDWVVRHDNRFYQVEGQSWNYAPAKSKVRVCEWEDGTREIHYRGRKLIHHEIEERTQKPEVVAFETAEAVHSGRGAPAEPSLAEELSGYESAGRILDRGGRAGFRGPGLRSALSARPKGLAGLRSGRGHGNPKG